MPPHRIYLDYAAATPLEPRVLAAMEPYWHSQYGNPGSLHSEGLEARAAVDEARRTIAQTLNAHPDEIMFTSGGTEANNLAILGVPRAYTRAHPGMPFHVITTEIEHSSVIDTVRSLEGSGAEVSVLPVDRVGLIDPAVLRAALRPYTILVSVITASNEIGTIQPVSEVACVLKGYADTTGNKPLLHTDASQAPAWLPLNVDSLGVDLMTLDAQKVYGPKGAGCLYRKRGVALEPILFGGMQEGGMRPGTPVVPLVVGFAESLRIVNEERSSYVNEVARLRDLLIERVRLQVPTVELNGAKGNQRLANNVNLSYEGLDAERIVIELDARGIAASSRSACLLGEKPGSAVVRALGKGEGIAKSAVRLTLGRHTSQSDIEQAAASLVEVYETVRGAS